VNGSGLADRERIDMGRIARRVPLDFDWPLNEVWGGYLMPDRLSGVQCPDCGGRGMTVAAGWLEKVAYVIAELADDADSEARGREMHPWVTPLREISYGGYGAGRPGREFAEFADGLGIEAGFMGRNPHRAYGALVKAAGLPEKWGWCPTCEGHGSVESYPCQRDEAEAWEPAEPPTGEGWQLWETTSEGSPTSPVFATAEALAEWCVDGATIFGSHRGGRDQWLAIITGEDFAHVEIAPGVVMM
jgi:hypothetical protein